MRDPWGLNERFFAFYYPIICGIAERAGQRETRRRLLSQAGGRTLEVGAGSGLNIEHYPEAVTELVITEPSPHMLDHLRAALDEHTPPVGSATIEQAAAEDLPYDDASFDTVAMTFVLCSVEDPARVLDEIARVLTPGGRYLFLEHVHAGEGTLLGRFQDLVEVPHRYIAAGCHPNRRTEQLLAAAPLEVERLEHGKQPRAPATVRPTIIGSARRPQAA
jgi:SAM-dependent methyltransferase